MAEKKAREVRERILERIKKKLEENKQSDVISYVDARLKYLEEDLVEELKILKDELVEFKQQFYNVIAEVGNTLILKGYILNGFETGKITGDFNKNKGG